MEKDNLKEFIKQQRDDFDSEILPEKMFSRIVTGLDKRKAAGENRLFFSMAACLAGLMVFSAFLVFVRKEPGKDNNIPVSGFVETLKIHPQKEPEVPVYEVQNVTLPTKRKQITKIKNNFHRTILSDLRDSLSVSRRIEGILKIGDMKSVDYKLKTALCNTFEKDVNSNVRLAALNVLLKFSEDSLVHQYLVNGLSTEEDPVIQMELVRSIGQNAGRETVKGLIELAKNPVTLSEIRDQVYYALLTR